MKKLLPILLITLFSHTLLWGQDDDFLKFRPLELVDTSDYNQLMEKFARIDKWGSDSLMILEKCEIEYEDAYSCYKEYFIVKKNGTTYLKYSLPYENASFYGYIDTASFTIQTNLISYEAHDSYRFLTSAVFVVIDLNHMNFCEINKYYSSVFDEIEGAYYSYETKSEIMLNGNKLLIFNTECNQDVDYPIPNKGPCYEETNPNDGEYHYINGNFVKVKPYIGLHTFTHSVYNIGEKTYLTPECAFYFECDCCFDQVLFTSDSTFIVISPCTEETSVSHGRYEVIDNIIYLHYSGIWKHRYMVLDEQDKPTKYAFKTNMVPWYTRIFSPELCKNTTLYFEQTKSEIKMLRSEETLESKLAFLKRIGLLD